MCSFFFFSKTQNNSTVYTFSHFFLLGISVLLQGSGSSYGNFPQISSVGIWWSQNLKPAFLAFRTHHFPRYSDISHTHSLADICSSSRCGLQCVDDVGTGWGVLDEAGWRSGTVLLCKVCAEFTCRNSFLFLPGKYSFSFSKTFLLYSQCMCFQQSHSEYHHPQSWLLAHRWVHQPSWASTSPTWDVNWNY